MIYKVGMKVIIQDKDNKLVDAIILQPVDFGEEELWWIEFHTNGHREVEIVSAAKLDVWNAVSIAAFCVCGSAKTQQPRHSTWCDVK